MGPEGTLVTSVTLRLINGVADFIGCNERTVRRHLDTNKPYRGYLIRRQGKTSPKV